MGANLRAEEIDDEVRESADHVGGTAKARIGIDEADNVQPGRNAVEIADLALQLGKNREGGEARGFMRLLR